MVRPVEIAWGGRSARLSELPWPLPLDEMVPGRGPWEVELGFGKGRYLLQRSQADRGRVRFVGIEMALKYFRIARDRAWARGIDNLVLLHGDALFLLSAVLPRALARAVHVYFPDPWPKSRHGKRRLFDESSVDLVVRLLRPGGRLLFATDHREYGRRVQELLASFPGVRVEERKGGWEGGPRTNYEAKYEAEGRAIFRLEAAVADEPATLHPAGDREVVAAPAPAGEERS